MPLAPFSATERWLEDHVGTHDALGASSADVTIWQLIRFRLTRDSDATFTSVSKSSANAAKFHLDIHHDLAFSVGGVKE
jgi:hypothetical protein